jgi:hypothetical protein
VLVVLAGCGSAQEVTSGRVIDRAYHPAHSETNMVADYRTETDCSTDPDGHIDCTSKQVLTGYHSERKRFPDRWTITVERCFEDHCARRDVEVTQADFDRVIVGDDHWDEKTGIV